VDFLEVDRALPVSEWIQGQPHDVEEAPDPEVRAIAGYRLASSSRAQNERQERPVERDIPISQVRLEA